MGSLSDKVAFITGAARGQGREHAVRLAKDGCNIIAVDLCHDMPTIDYPLGTREELAETVSLVEALGRQIVAHQADVRDVTELSAAFHAGFTEFGRVDIVIANAGVTRIGAEKDPYAEFADVADTIIKGTWHTIRVALPAMKDSGRGGSIVLVSSSAGLKPTASDRAAHIAYTTAKTGLIGMMKTYAAELARPYRIRVNSIHPTGVGTGMTWNDAMVAEAIGVGAETGSAITAMRNALPIDMLRPAQIADVVAWLVSDQADFITGAALPLDAGFSVL